MNEVHVVATVLSVDLENAYDVLATLGASAALTHQRDPVRRPGRRRARRPHRRRAGRQPDARARSRTSPTSTSWSPAPPTPSSWSRPAPRRSPRPSSSRRSSSPTRRSRSSSTCSSSCSSSSASPSGTSPSTTVDEGVLDEVRAGFGADDRRAPRRSPDKKERQDATADGQERGRRGSSLGEDADPERVDAGQARRRQAREGHHPRPHRRREAPPRRPRAPTRSAPITCEVGVIPRTHGSALFTRGQTQALTPAHAGRHRRVPAHRRPRHRGQEALHPPLQLPAVLGGRDRLHARPQAPRHRPRRPRRARPAAGPARRGRRSPTRSASSREILESNGSSSMASVCGSTLVAHGRRRADQARRSPASPWASSRRATTTSSSPTSPASRTTSATWTSRSPAPPRASPPCRWTSRSRA